MPKPIRGRSAGWVSAAATGDPQGDEGRVEGTAGGRRIGVSLSPSRREGAGRRMRNVDRPTAGASRPEGRGRSGGIGPVARCEARPGTEGRPEYQPASVQTDRRRYGAAAGGRGDRAGPA